MTIIHLGAPITIIIVFFSNLGVFSISVRGRSVGGPFGIRSRSVWGLCGVRSRPVQDPFGIRAGSVRAWFGRRTFFVGNLSQPKKAAASGMVRRGAVTPPLPTADPGLITYFLRFSAPLDSAAIFDAEVYFFGANAENQLF